MAIKKYRAVASGSQTHDLIFSVVADTALFNAIIDDSSAYQLMPWSGLTSCIIYPAEGTIDNATYLSITDLVPVVEKIPIYGLSSTGISFDYALAPNKVVRAYNVYIYQTNPNTLLGGCRLVNTATDAYFTTQNSQTPIGKASHWTVNTSALNVIYIGFLVANDDLSNFKVVQISANRGNPANVTLGSINAGQVATLVEFFRDLEPIVEEIDPYDGAGDSEPGGGGGTFDYAGNPPGGADDFSPPSISAVDTGFVTLYNPTVAQLKQLSNYLWSNDFDLNLFKKIFNDPMDLFLGLSIVPVPVPDGGTKEVGIGLVGSGVYMTVAASQWVKVTCGSVTIPNFTGSYLDYDPYLSVEIYLPYIGSRALKADEVMGKTLKVTYWVDILSGACIAWIDIDGHVTYTYMGQCATSIPTVAGDWTNLINGILSVVGGAVGGAVKGGVGGAIAGGVAAASAVAVTDGKISVERAGTISSAGGLLAHPKPFLIINAPRLCKPAAQNQFEGYPSYITQRIGDCQGFTQIERVRLQNVHASEEELNEILSYLQSGVIL